MEKNTSRIEAFSDGIFAVAITLLAIDIGVDMKDMEAHHVLEATTNEELTQQLIALWPKLFAYFNSFASVLLMWMSHHQIFKMLKNTTNRLMLVNGFLLLVIALAPFPTKTLGEFIDTEAWRTAIIFYTGYAVLVSATYVLFINTVKSKSGSLLLSHVSTETVARISNGLWLGFLLNSGIFILTFFAPLLGLVLNFCMWIFWAFMSRDNKEEPLST